LEITHNKEGKEIEKTIRNSPYKPPMFAYVVQSLQLIIISFQLPNYDVVIAQDSLLAFLALLLKLFGKVKTVVYYSHGLDKTRFPNTLLNIIYSNLDLISAKNADYNWFLSKRMGEIRKKQYIDKEKLYWIPSSIPIRTVARKQKVTTKKIVFLGTVDNKNGAHLLAEMIALVRKKIPQVSLDVMGNGPYFDQLKKDIQEKKLEKQISILGQLQFGEFAQKLTHYALGIAPYTFSNDNLTPLSDSLKMRIYLAAGLPVVITRGFHFSNEIATHKLGFAVENNAKAFADAIIKLLENQKLNNETRKWALLYSEKYDVWKFYQEAFKRVLRNP
jgi:glycosyltransferase involved in cell wall biosynthesis